MDSPFGVGQTEVEVDEDNDFDDSGNVKSRGQSEDVVRVRTDDIRSNLTRPFCWVPMSGDGDEAGNTVKRIELPFMQVCLPTQKDFLSILPVSPCAIV